MPSPIGHIMAGFAIAWSAERPNASGSLAARPLSAFALTCAALTTLPDLDLVDRATHRTMTHSFVAVAAIACAAAVWTRWRAGKVNWRAALLFGGAYGSHLLLDWLAADRKQPPGLQLLWPFSEAWFISSWPLFHAAELHEFLSRETIVWNIRTIVWEVVVLAPILALVWMARYRRSARPSSTMAERAPQSRLKAALPDEGL
jgi:membrane-bound metal-dependent hydrolase YbcI (DUF457 family)